MAYVDVPFDPVDPDELLADALDRLETALPGYVPRKTQQVYVMLAEGARLAADVRALAADVPDAIFRTFGQKVAGVPALEGTPATGTAVLTVEQAGQIVPAGTSVGWSADPFDPTVQALRFVTGTAVTGLAAAAGGGFDTAPVQIIADTVGEAGNDLPAGPLTLDDPLVYVVGVRATSGSAGGTDPEDDLVYLDRLSDAQTLSRRVPVLARDYPPFARQVPGVHRALAIDNYSPRTGLLNQERTVAVAAVDADGQPVSTTVKERLDALMQSEREANFIVEVFDPTYTSITVSFTGTAQAGADPARVQADAVQSAQDFLSPAFWAGGRERPPVWRRETLVRYLDVAAVVGSTPGLLHLTDLLVNGGRANVTLDGQAPLPLATVTGAVTA